MSIATERDGSDIKNDKADVVEGEPSEQFIYLPKPQPFTRAVTDAVEYRPAAIQIICHFLQKLSAKCKADLHRLGCSRPAHQLAPKPPHQGQAPPPGKHHGRHHHHHHHPKESWDKRFQRLKVYQRAFSSVVMYFKAYCPALFHIKKAYEDMLSYRINQIKVAHFEKKRLHIEMRNMKHQMDTYRFPEHHQLRMCEKYLIILRQRIALQDDAIKVITEILTRMEEALSDHFEKHRDLEEQIVMVDTEIANRRQKAFSMREKEEKEVKEKTATTSENEASKTIIDSDEEDKEDPFYGIDAEEIDEERRMVWIMAFAICHKDLEEAEKRINMYQTKYQYVVPRHELESMKRSIVDERGASKTYADEKMALEMELGNLKELEVKLTEELAEVKTQLTELRTTVTPRPSWEQLGEFVQGGVPKWKSTIRGKSTRDVAEKLFSELRTRRGGDKFLQPLGTEHNILRCLRHGKKVPDRQLHSRDAALLIHDIWMARKQALEENLAKPKQEDDFDFGKNENLATKSFPDFVALYFENRYEDVEQRMEWTYNLVECCKRFSLDYRLTLFLNVLQGWADEGIYFVTKHELFRVRNTFLEKSVDEGMTHGILSSNQYVEALEVTFPRKPEPEIQSIVRVTNKLNAELNSQEDADLSVYYITQLIDVRDDGFRGALVGELVKQFEEGRQVFIEKVIAALAMILDISPHSAMNESDPASNRDVSVVQVYSAIQKADLDLHDDHIGAALAWIFTQTSVLPGCGISTSRLTNYCKLNSGVETEAPSLVPVGDVAQADEEKFERAIRDIVRDEEESEGEPQVSEAQRKTFLRALKHAKLRTVVKRLKGSALVPSWQIYDPKDSLLPEAALDVEVDLKPLQAAYDATHKKPEVLVHEGETEGMRLSLDLGGEEHEDGEGAAPQGEATAAPPSPVPPPQATN